MIDINTDMSYNCSWKAAPLKIRKKWGMRIERDFGEIGCEYGRRVKLCECNTEWIDIMLVPRLVFGRCHVRSLARPSAVITKVFCGFPQ
jgi:hypothetical protein